MSWELFFVGLFFAMAGSILFFSKSPQVRGEKNPKKQTSNPEPAPVLRPAERMFDYSKVFLSPREGIPLAPIYVVNKQGGLLFYVEKENSLIQGLQMRIFMNQTRQDLLLMVDKAQSFQMTPMFSIYDKDQRSVGQLERDPLSGEKTRWYLADGSGKRFAHVEKDKEAINWSNLSDEPRHSEKYNIIPGALVAGTINKDDYNPEKYILDLSQDNGRVDRRIALCMALVLMHQ